jgi:hypothetical protein
MGGANVTTTYRRGKVDAEAVAAEIKGAGGRCSVAQFDSNRPAQVASQWLLTLHYYFATPHVESDLTTPARRIALRNIAATMQRVLLKRCLRLRKAHKG